MKTVRRDALRPGDHIYTDRKLHLNFHLGIYVGDDMVIHLMGPTKVYTGPPCKKCGFKPRAGIFKTCLDCFLEGHSLYCYEYNVSSLKLLFERRGTCSTWDCKTADQVVETACLQLQEKNFRSYNCEDFAVYCKTSVAMTTSSQTSGLHEFFKDLGMSSRTSGLYKIYIGSPMSPKKSGFFAINSIRATGLHHSDPQEYYNSERTWPFVKGFTDKQTDQHIHDIIERLKKLTGQI